MILYPVTPEFIYNIFRGTQTRDVFSRGMRIPRGLFAHTLTDIKADKMPAARKDETERIIVSFFKINTVLLIKYFIITSDKLHYIIVCISEFFNL